jgi:uncharacterized repeat protein (TIGR03803 family)
MAPKAILIDVKCTLYGTTSYGGGTDFTIGYGCGTVFSFDPATGAEPVLHAFAGGTDRELPFSGLIDVKGTLYGTTDEGGASGFGTAFALDPATGAETVLHAFTGGADEEYPLAGLIDVKGTLYGTTVGSPPLFTGYGTVFVLRK